MDEILVHVSAPTTRGNDDMYRALSEAYASFEPYDQGQIDSRQSESGLQAGNAARESFDEAEVTALTESKETYGSFPSHITSKQEQDVPTYLAASFDSLQDSLVDSSRLAQLERMQRHWRKRKAPRASLLPKSSINATSNDDANTTFIEDSQAAAQALESQLFDHGSTTSEATSEEEEEFDRREDDKRSTVDPPQKWPNLVSESLLPAISIEDSNVRSEPPTTWNPSTRRRTVAAGIIDSNVTPTPTRPFTQSFQDEHLLPPGDTIFTEESYSALPASYDFSQLPLEVFAPTPKVTVQNHRTLPTQITPYLERVRQQNLGRFMPSLKSRTPESDERGYWLIETAQWSQKEQHDFWCSVCKHVRSGEYGWGVMLAKDGGPSTGSGGLGPIRLYCWGEMVEAIWLSLLVCSRGRIAGFGAKWLDADDSVVVRIP